MRSPGVTSAGAAGNGEEEVVSINYVESKVRTNRLHCSDCGRKIRKGEEAVFKLDDCEDKPMQGVYGPCCKDAYEIQVIDSQQHPHDLDGQDHF